MENFWMKNSTNTPDNSNNENKKTSCEKYGLREGLERFPCGGLSKRVEGWWEILIMIKQERANWSNSNKTKPKEVKHSSKNLDY